MNNVNKDPAIGIDSETAATRSELVAGKDGSGNHQDVRTDTSGRLEVTGSTSSAAIPITFGGAPGVGDGTATVTSAGTAVQLPDVSCGRVMIQAHIDNTGTIAVGGSTVVAATSGRRGRTMRNFQTEVFHVSNLNLLYIDSTASGDIVHYFYET